MTPNTAIRPRRRTPQPSAAVSQPARAGTVFTGPTTGVATVAAWYAACCARYGGQDAGRRLDDTPAHVAELLVRLRQRFGTDGLNPHGRAWVERMIHTTNRTERREMTSALRTAYAAVSGPAAA